MYIWIGINVEKDLINVKEIAQKVDNELKFKNSCFTLPLHISLKISFKIDDNSYNDVIEIITNYYKNLSPFIINIKELEKDNNIIWIRMKENEYLNKIHDDLNNILQDKFNISMHEYDYDYKFHTTLYMDDNLDKINKAYNKVKEINLPLFVHANNFIIGESKEGLLGSYHVLKEVHR